MDRTVIAADGARLHVSITGGADLPTVLLLHGITDGGATWSRVAHALREDAQVVMPDARGHGRSARVESTPDVATLAGDAVAVLEDLGGEPALIWGHSMGADTAATLAATRPELVRAVVLEDPPYAAAPPQPSPGEVDDDPHLASFIDLLRRMPQMSASERLEVARNLNPTWHIDECEPWATTKAEVDLRVLAMFGGALGRGWRDTVASVTCPVLLLTGDPDSGAIVTPEVAAELAALTAALTVVRLPGAGHSVHRDRFDLSLEAVRPFLLAHA